MEQERELGLSIRLSLGLEIGPIGPIGFHDKSEKSESQTPRPPEREVGEIATDPLD